MRGVARTAAVAGTATAVSGRVARRQQRKWGEQDAEAYAQQEAAAPEAAAPPPPAPAAGEPEYIEELEKLASLRDQGIISADDFEAKKKQLLGI